MRRDRGCYSRIRPRLINFKNSERVCCWVRKSPIIWLVTATVFCFSTPAHHHAKVLRLDDDTNALRVKLLHERFGNLHGQMLLHLQAATEGIHDARDFAEAHDLLVGDVADVALTEERQEVMFAERKKVDVLDDHHLVVINREQRAVEQMVHVLPVAPCHELPCLSHARRCVAETVACGVFAQRDQHLRHQGFHIGDVGRPAIALHARF